MANVYDVFGVNALDIWELPVDEFLAMTVEIDRLVREAKKPDGH